MLETESKFLVGNIRNVEKHMQELGATLIEPRTFESNIRYDQPDKTLSNNSRLLRLRTDKKTTLTYKGTSENDHGILKRLEIEVSVDDPIQVDLILRALGYEQIFVYEKYRTTYGYLNTRIMLDELPMGDFIEIEAKDTFGAEAIHRVADQLKLQWGSSIPMSYHALFERLRRSAGFGFADLTFNNFKQLAIHPEDLGIHRADE